MAHGGFMDIKTGHNSQAKDVLKLNDGYHRNPVRTTLHVEGPVIAVCHDSFIEKMVLTPELAFTFARSLMECAFKAERNVHGLLPSKKDVDTFEEVMCGEPRIICQQPLLSRLIRPTKEL